MKKFILLLGVMLISISLLSACEGNGNGNAQITEEETKTLVFWNRLGELKSYWPQIIEDFEKENPNINIKLENLGASGNQQFQTAIKNNELPDVFITANVMSLKRLVELEQLHELSNVITEEVREDFKPGTWAENHTTIDGGIYQLPLYSGNHQTIMMYYNKEVLDEYGISEDNIPETWDQLMEVSQEIYQESGGSTYGIILGLKSAWLSDMFIRQMATAITPEVPTDMSLLGGIDYTNGNIDFAHQGNIESIQFIKDLHDNNALAPESVENDSTQAEALFSVGKAAFLFQGNWTGTVLVDEQGNNFENWGVAPLPTKNGEKYFHSQQVKEGVMVSKYTDNLKEAEEFIKYLLDNVYSDVIVSSGASQPAKDIDIDEDNLPFPQYEEISNIMDEYNIQVPNVYQRNVATVEFMSDYYAGISNSVGNILLGYMTGQVTSLEAELRALTEEAKRSFNTALEKYEDVNRDDFIFPNWTPTEPYTNDKYEELD